jgi:ammonia channel protein AmtB
VGFFLFGWALAFGPAGGDENSATPVLGTADFALIGDVDYAAWVFHLSFAATAATIVSGATAGRIRFK